MRLTILLLLWLGLGGAAAQTFNTTACRAQNCSNAGTCQPDYSCICDTGGSGYGPQCNQTAFQCGFSQCNGRGVCVSNSATQCMCGLTHYDGSQACGACITGWNLTTGCTTCAQGYFGPNCATTAAQCGATQCNSAGTCTGAGNSTGCQCFSNLYTNQNTCTGSVCGTHGAPDPATNYTTCACSLYFAPNTSATPQCQVQCTNGGTPNSNSSACVCPDPFYGIACEYTAITCGANGNRTSHTTCACFNFYTGANCTIPPVACANGTLTSPTTCACNGFYSGSACTIPPIACNGTLTGPTTCVCAGFYSGAACTVPPLPCVRGYLVNASYCQCTGTLTYGLYCNLTQTDCGSWCTRVNDTACLRTDGLALDCFTFPPTLTVPTSPGLSELEVGIVAGVSVVGGIILVVLVWSIVDEIRARRRLQSDRPNKKTYRPVLTKKPKNG